MPGKDFLYFLVNTDGLYYKCDNGIVSAVSDPSPLLHTPDGWLNIEVQRTRSIKYFGLDRSFTIPLDFVKDGAHILKYLFYNFGMEEKVFLVIAEKKIFCEPDPGLVDELGNPITDQNGNPLTSEALGNYYYYYTSIYKGEIDFSQFKHAGPRVTVNIMEGGINKLLRANEGTQYEIPMTNDKIVAVNIDGVKLIGGATFKLVNQAIGGSSTIYSIVLIGDEIKTATAFVQTQTGTSPAGGINFQTTPFGWDNFSGQGIIRTDTKNKFRLQGSFGYKGVPGTGANMLYLVTSRNRLLFIQNVGYNVPAVELDIEVELQAGEELFIAGNAQGFDGPNVVELVEADLKISYTSRKSESYVRAMRPLTLFTELCAKMGVMKADSVLLKTNENVVLTCGDALRGFDAPVLKTSFNDFFTSINTVFSVGIGIVNNVLRLESKEFFVDYANPIDLGECKDLTIQPATDFIFNTIKIGYPDQNFEDVNGRSEFNTTHTYSSPIRRFAKELSLTSIYRADCYGIEYARVNFDGRTTTDSKSDDDIFFLHIKKKPTNGPFVVFEYYDLDRTLNQYVEGVIDPESVFNVWLSPKRCLLRHGSFLRSMFYKLDHEKLIFQSSEKNSEMVVNQPGAYLEERGDISIGTFGPKIFDPVLIEIDTVVPSATMELLRVSPNRTFKFTYEGMTYIGFPIKDSISPATNEGQTYQFLSAPSNNLSQLITEI